MFIEPAPKSTATVHHSFSCGAEGEHRGGIVGCCYICGKLLCEAHTYYMPNSPIFAALHGQGELAALACSLHAGENSRRSLPRERQFSETNSISGDSPKIIRRPKSKPPKPSGRRV